LRARRPFARSRFIVSTSTLSGAWPLVPGPSKRAGSFSKRGFERKAPQPGFPLVAARAVDHLAELLEGPADGVAGAGRVLKQEMAVIRLGQPDYPLTTQTAVISR
jgi:hypothetical protein